MTKRLRPLRKLYFKHLEGTELAHLLSPLEVAQCLQAQGLVMITRNLDGETRYFETEHFHEFSEREIFLMLKQYFSEKKPRETA